jgi:deoxycytidylate deaminase
MSSSAAGVDTSVEEPRLSQTELIVGLVGALGTELDLVASKLSSRLGEVFAYRVETISVSSLMQDLDWHRDLRPPHEDARIRANMDAGRDLNRAWREHFNHRHDALARLAVLKVDAIRTLVNNEMDRDSGEPLDRFAFILRSFKRPDEIRLLRAIYGERFLLIGVYAPRARRRKRLYDTTWPSYATEVEDHWHDDPDLALDHLIDRDERERGEAGQNVRDSFHQADFFVDDDPGRVGDQIERCLRVLFGDPFVTPTRDENGVAHATTAALRSAEPGRQVGAAVCTDAGDLLAVGTNEVPRAFGGQYWPEDEDDGAGADGREFTVGGKDTNNVRQEAIAQSIVDLLKGHAAEAQAELDELLAEARMAPESEQEQALKRIADELAALTGEPAKRLLLNESSLGDITEYGRAVHAEMAAITTAARLGTSIQDGVMYSTTFPCHNCARHIIATGIRRLVYIAPYAKSQAHALHRDSLVVAPDQMQTAEQGTHVVFEPFVGVAPRRYGFLFDAPARKDPDGTLRSFDATSALPRLRDADPEELGLNELSYRLREDVVVSRTRSVIGSTTPALITEEPVA